MKKVAPLRDQMKANLHEIFRHADGRTLSFAIGICSLSLGLWIMLLGVHGVLNTGTLLVLSKYFISYWTLGLLQVIVGILKIVGACLDSDELVIRVLRIGLIMNLFLLIMVIFIGLWSFPTVVYFLQVIGTGWAYIRTGHPSSNPESSKSDTGGKD